MGWGLFKRRNNGSKAVKGRRETMPRREGQGTGNLKMETQIQKLKLIFKVR
jgi:hypothetical protein